MMQNRILIIEDERELAEVLKRHLDEANFEVRLAGRGDLGLRIATSEPFDLILLDLMLPGIDGLELCRRLRSQQVYTPVLMLTAKSAEVDKVLGLETGADDYLTKPFGMAELLARVRAIFRRVESLSARAKGEQKPLRFGGVLRIDPSSREVRVRDRSVALSHREFDLLWHFAQNPGRVYSRAQLLDAVWGYGHDGYEHAINCQINRLRMKIERDQTKPEVLLTVWGVGYKFAEHLGTE